MIDPLKGSLELWTAAQQRASLASEGPAPRAKCMRASLKQWRMLEAVVDCNGFVEAAERLHLSQSSISHALNKLQEQLGLRLLIIRGRKAQLTEEGKILLARSRELVRSAVELEELAENMRQGWGAEIRLAVDPDFPSDLLMHGLREQVASTRRLRLSVQEATAEQCGQALHDNAVDLAISTHIPPGFLSKELIGIEHVAVAHPGNPLFRLNRDLGIDELRGQCQVTIAGSNDYALADPAQRAPQSPRPWKVDSLDRAVAILAQGLGYAWLPKYRLQRWFDANQLRVLPIHSGASRIVCLYLIHGRSVTATPSILAFAESLRSLGPRVY
jgi:DNA-binding transcriptional LysR family regulator